MTVTHGDNVAGCRDPTITATPTPTVSTAFEFLTACS